ncbi:MAG TPA: hypothetical protein VHW93_07135 [Acidimicrobiales bacterium]|jgi:hypothetical protein|nr:hypothetical protein [Acidimicrobiales bacterium]
MDSILTEPPSVVPSNDAVASPISTDAAGPMAVPEVAAGDLADLHDPDLVLSTGYIGTDRRARSRLARLRRITFSQRKSLLRLEGVIAAAAVLVVVSVLMIDTKSHDEPKAAGSTSSGQAAAAHGTSSSVPAVATPTTSPVPTTTVAPATTVAPVAAAAPAVTAPPASGAALTPDQLGAQALTLVRYPWQNLPGYSIQFLPISDAPSPGFYGNTTFSWGQTGGHSVLYVYPGETVDRLAAITAFEIAHEVDASAVEPQGGEAQIENILNIHPASWAPDCDCAEQGFLSGWYAAAFSDYWSPGVGDWSSIAPEPTGATLTAIEPWLNPAVP